MPTQVTTLSNGLRIATETIPHLQTVAITIAVGTGARYEDLAESGISHLLEHMAFKGTTTRGARDIAEQFDMIGGQLNAYTSVEITVYHAKIMAGDAPRALEILADILQHSVFAEDELAREREVILQEIAMHNDTPDDLIFDLFDEVAYPAQPMGRSILGPESQVSRYRRDDLFAYMRKHYTPQRMIISAAGNIGHDAFVSLTERYFDLPASPPAPAFEPARYRGGEIKQEKKLEQLHLAVGLPAFSLHDPDYYALQVYTGILGGGMSSRLFQEVREKRGLAYTIYASANGYSDCGMMTIYTASGTKEKAALVELLAEELAKMSGPVQPPELTRAKNQMKAELLMAREQSMSIANMLGRHLLLYGRIIPISEIIAKVEAVSEADIQRVSRRLLAASPTLAALGPVKGLPDLDALVSRLAA